ncbi:MAG: membrane protein insertase YidC, partial [Rhodobacteraceae bacterium]|nr:membrane protein insertase YidC [Paracoccaceae bacterium]
IPPPATGEAGAGGTAAAPSADPATAAPRLTIETDRLSGSISLRGGRLDDLSLADYRETLDPGSPVVRLLSPVGQDGAYYALHGWTPAGALAYEDVPGANTLWSAPAGARLTPQTPVTLSWDNGKGLVFTRTLSVDDDYLFTVTQSVRNDTDAPVRLAPYGLIARHGMPDNLQRFFILHEGVVQMADGTLTEIKYADMEDAAVLPREGAPAQVAEAASGGWIGFTDKYWMTTLVPSPGAAFTAVSKYVPGPEIYQTEARLPTLEVAPGADASVTTSVFAGAKEWETIRAYQRAGIDRFVDAIDWGWFFFFTKPIFTVLHFLNGLIGNMGWSIMALTLFLKALVLPLAYKSYVSMARMKELQPEMEALKERAGDDRQKLQQEMMKLYKEKKVNPAAGCLPILIQIPIFFSLYKVIFVTIELRHAPWLGWIRDLSAPDPSSILNLFGLLPYAPPGPDSFLSIVSLGVLPILLGISMWLQQKLNPAPTDPTQKMIFAWMPWVFMFMLGRFASGLVLYWITNNVVTFVQQYAIMRSHGHKPDIFGNIRAGFRRGGKDGAEAKAANSPKPPPAPPRKGSGRGGK